MKRVFVIGGKRFVGAAVVKLLSTKYDVTVLNRSGIKPTDNCTVIQMDRVNISSFLLRNQDIIIDMCAYNLTQVKELLKSHVPKILIKQAENLLQNKNQKE